VQLDAEAARASGELNEGRYVRLVVRDNGAGIDKAVIQRIFEPFFTTKDPGQGTGLGLSVVHGIVQSHGGAITVYSELGKGTVFHLYFPAVEKTTAAVADAVTTEAPRKSGQHVLYVDDESTIVTLITLTLKRLGYRVTGCTDPVQALEAFTAEPDSFDIVITDLSMPGMSGPELARRLLAIQSDVPIILTSGYMSDADMANARDIGIQGFVAKPTNLENLDKKIQELLDNSR